jgi:hypothetical protein
VARRLRLSTWFVRHVGEAVRPGTERSRALAAALRALASSPDLPAPQDYQAVRRPTGRAWVRRVAGENLWAWYRLKPEELLVLAVTTEPPLPFEEA